MICHFGATNVITLTCKSTAPVSFTRDDAYCERQMIERCEAPAGVKLAMNGLLVFATLAMPKFFES